MALLDMKILMDVFFSPTSLSAILLVASFSCVMLFLIPLFVSLIELCHKIRNIDNKVNNFQSSQEKVSLNYCYIYLLRTIILNMFFFAFPVGVSRNWSCLYYKFQSVAVLWKWFFSYSTRLLGKLAKFCGSYILMPCCCGYYCRPSFRDCGFYNHSCHAVVTSWSQMVINN